MRTILPKTLKKMSEGWQSLLRIFFGGGRKSGSMLRVFLIIYLLRFRWSFRSFPFFFCHLSPDGKPGISTSGLNYKKRYGLMLWFKKKIRLKLIERRFWLFINNYIGLLEQILNESCLALNLQYEEVPYLSFTIRKLDKGKPPKRVGRKATGLNPENTGHGSRAAGQP